MTTLIAAALFQHQVQPARPRHFGYLMDYQVVAQGDRPVDTKDDMLVAGNRTQWDKLREKLAISDDEDKKLTELHGPLGAIDWTREQVAWARASEQPSGGYTLSVQMLQKLTDDGWRLDLTVHPPKAGTMNVMMLTRPWILLRFRAASGSGRVFFHVAKPKG